MICKKIFIYILTVPDSDILGVKMANASQVHQGVIT